MVKQITPQLKSRCKFGSSLQILLASVISFIGIISINYESIRKFEGMSIWDIDQERQHIEEYEGREFGWPIRWLNVTFKNTGTQYKILSTTRCVLSILLNLIMVILMTMFL